MASIALNTNIKHATLIQIMRTHDNNEIGKLIRPRTQTPRRIGIRLKVTHQESQLSFQVLLLTNKKKLIEQLKIITIQ